ncbi:MAG: ABC transporter transmembrane domain-containing protein [Pseudonocardia sp.]
MIIVVWVLLSSGLGIITPFLTKARFDQALFPVDGSGRRHRAARLVGRWHAVPVVTALIGLYQTFPTTLLGNRVMADLRGRLFEHPQRMDLSFFTANRTGAIQSRPANDVSQEKLRVHQSRYANNAVPQAA